MVTLFSFATVTTRLRNGSNIYHTSSSNRFRQGCDMTRAHRKAVRIFQLIVALTLGVGFTSATLAVTGTWSAGRSLETARTNHTATLLPSGKVLVAGGRGGSGFLVSAELHDPLTDTWHAAGSLTTARANHTATLLPSGKVLAVGGSAKAQPLKTAEL